MDVVTDSGEARILVEKSWLSGHYQTIGGGGGGIGMTIVSNEKELAGALEATRTIAANTFGVVDVLYRKISSKPPAYRVSGSGGR